MFHENQQIGNYTLIRKLGRGGFGEVWLAERKSKFVTTKVAVKLPHDEQVDHEAIKQEATLWEQASGHPNILPIIDADEYDGQIVIVSEYAPDGSLEQWLKTHGKMPIEKAIETTIQILDGLEFLHSRNIIHRDLKPANILLQGSTPRLADFGISRALRTTVASQSQNISGTFAYMSPEALDGKRSIQTDIWSVGVNLYQFLTGILPFPNKEPSVLLAAIMMREFEPLPADIPNNLQNVIAKALTKQPENRYASAAAMREDLRRILRGEAVSDFIQSYSRQNYSASEIPPTQKAAPIFAQNFQDENETVVRSAPNFGQSEKRRISNIWMYAMLALVLVSAIGVGVYFWENQSKQDDSNKSRAVQTSPTQPSNNSANSENINASIVSNTNITTPTPIPTLNKAQLQRTINQHVSNFLRGITKGDFTFEELKGKRKLFYGDIDNDGDEDVALQYTWTNSYGGDAWGINIAIFRNNNGLFEFIDSENVGGDLKNFNMTGIKNRKIYAITETCTNPEDEYVLDCIAKAGGSKKQNTQYSLHGNKLVEK